MHSVPPNTLPHLPSAASYAELGHILLVIAGAAIALFGLGIYHGALRFFGTIIGGTFGFLLFLSNKETLPALGGWGPLIWSIVYSLIGGWIGGWLAALASYAIFFVLGCVTGYYGVLVGTGQWTQVEKALVSTHMAQLDKFGPQGWQWLVVVGVGLIYLMASNWILLITCAIVGASMVSTALNNGLYLIAGAPFGMFVQWVLYMRHGMPSPRQVRMPRPHKPIIYDRGDDEDY